MKKLWPYYFKHFKVNILIISISLSLSVFLPQASHLLSPLFLKLYLVVNDSAALFYVVWDTFSNCDKFYLWKQRDARIENGLTYVSGNDSYNMEEMVMPLQQFINEPITLEVLHNGATFQVSYGFILITHALVCIFITSLQSAFVSRLFPIL